MTTINKNNGIQPKYAGSEAPQTKEWAQEKYDKFEALLAEYQNVVEYSADLSQEEIARLNETIFMIKADMELLDYFIETGEWKGEGAVDDPATSGEIEQKIVDELAKAESGWQGNIDLDEDGKPKTNDEDKAQVEAAYANDNNVEYGGTVYVRQGEYDATDSSLSSGVALVMTDDMAIVTGKTVGKDIWMEIEYLDGTKKVVVLENMAIRVAEPIIIYGGNCTHGIKIDMSNVIRVSDGNTGPEYGATAGVWVFGTKFDDVLIGSQSSDYMVGFDGNDSMLGQAGDDLMFGDGINADPKGDGGIDTLDGGLGRDVLDGGGGGQDVGIIDKTDDVGGSKGIENTKTAKDMGEYEIIDNDMMNEVVGNATDWDAKVDTKNNEIVLENTTTADDNDGTIEINMPTYVGGDGKTYPYTYAQASQDGNDLIITFTAIDAVTKKPKMMVLRAQGFFRSDNKTNLIFNTNGMEPNIVDLHGSYSDALFGGDVQGEGINFGFNFVTMNGQGDSDVLLAPKNILDMIGVDVSELSYESSTSIDELKENAKNTFNSTETITDPDDPEGTPTTETKCTWGDANSDIWNGEATVEDASHTIVLDYNSANGTTGAYESDDSRTMNVPPPEAGYTYAIAQTKGDELYIIFVNPATNKQIVVKIEHGKQMMADGWEIRINGNKINVLPDNANVTSFMNTVNGGGGTDLLFGSTFSTEITGDDDNVADDAIVEGKYVSTDNSVNGTPPELDTKEKTTEPTEDPAEPEDPDA